MTATELAQDGNGDFRYKANISDVGIYRDDIETSEQFLRKELVLVLSLGFDNVRFQSFQGCIFVIEEYIHLLKCRLRCQAYPLYLRLEGLPHHDKNHVENIINGFVLFTASQSSSEKILKPSAG